MTVGAATKVDTINAGDGDNTVTTGAGNDVVTVGKGDSVIDVKAGNNTVTAGDSVTGNTAATIDAGDGNNTITAGAGGWAVTVGDGTNSITTGAGDDIIEVGTGVNTVNISAGGDDVVKLTTTSQSSGVFTTITGINAGDSIDLSGLSGTLEVGGVTTAGTVLGDKVTVGLEDYQTYIAQASASAAAGNVAWFQFGGNTYIVADDDGNGVFDNGTDAVIKLTGLVDLSTAELGGFNTIVIA